MVAYHKESMCTRGWPRLPAWPRRCLDSQSATHAGGLLGHTRRGSAGRRWSGPLATQSPDLTAAWDHLLVGGRLGIETPPRPGGQSRPIHGCTSTLCGTQPSARITTPVCDSPRTSFCLPNSAKALEDSLLHRRAVGTDSVRPPRLWLPYGARSTSVGGPCNEG